MFSILDFIQTYQTFAIFPCVLLNLYLTERLVMQALLIPQGAGL